MLTRAVARYIRISPRKTRKVIDLVRGLPVVKAGAVLSILNKRPSLYVKRLLNSAIDSADKRFHLSPADLYISSIKADGGPMLKRYRAASMGRATMVRHRTTHITLELDRIVRQEPKLATSPVRKSEISYGASDPSARGGAGKQQTTRAKREVGAKKGKRVRHKEPKKKSKSRS